MLNLADCKIVL